jgi:probable F420-dependent oxidoreductase
VGDLRRDRDRRLVRGVLRFQPELTSPLSYDPDMELGTLGVWTSTRALGEERLGEAARVAERLGYDVFWLGGSPRLPQLRALLEATDRLVAATGIVNIWAYEDPAVLAAEYAELAADFGERFVVGIGVGHPEATSDYRRPLTAMRSFLDGLDAAPEPLPRHRRCLAALAPRMLELARDRSLGAIPYFVPVEHTAAARAALGDGPPLAPEVAVVVDEDDERARRTAREYASLYLALRNYTSNLLRHGFDESDIADGGSDRLIDAVIPHGSAAQVADAVRAHFTAGADHVTVQTLGEDGIPERSWAAVAEALLSQR